MGGDEEARSSPALTGEEGRGEDEVEVKRREEMEARRQQMEEEYERALQERRLVLEKEQRERREQQVGAARGQGLRGLRGNCA